MASPSRPAASRTSGRGEARRSTKAGHVYDEIKEAILSGTLEPGSPIDKSALCDRLGMSRFPVAAALNRLAFERLVVIAPQHGSFVAKIALSDVREFMLLRRALEGDIAAEAARLRPQGLDQALERSLRYQGAAVEAQDRPGLYALDVDFHRTIAASLDLQHSAAVLDSLRSHLERVRRILLTPPGRMRSTLSEHGAVATAIASGDPEAARGAMRAHLAGTTVMFDTFARLNPSLFSDTP